MRVQVLAALLNNGSSRNVQYVIKFLTFYKNLLLWLVNVFFEFFQVLNGLLELIPVKNLRKLREVNNSLVLSH